MRDSGPAPWARKALSASAAVIAYTYVGFPAIVHWRARAFGRPTLVDAPSALPSVSVVIAAHNEAASIVGKVGSILDSNYPQELIEIVVASDGSTDQTVQAVNSIASAVVRCLDLPRVGKAAALQAGIDATSNDILVFTDANSIFTPDSVSRLMAPFADPDVGGVAGDQRYGLGREGEGGSARGERQYWDLDRMLKVAESAAGNVVSATGAIYAIRRPLCPQVPEGVTDDFAISTAVICAGSRLVFEPEAAAYEEVALDRRAEFARKVRIMTRGLRGVWLRRELLDPRQHGFYAIQLLTHKVLRRLMVLPLGILYVSSLKAAPTSQAIRLLALGQTAFYGAGLLGVITERTRLGRARVLALPAYFCMVNAAAAVAVVNLISGRRIDRWRTDRGSPGAPEAPR